LTSSSTGRAAPGRPQLVRARLAEGRMQGGAHALLGLRLALFDPDAELAEQGL
jgi:hypothetical protein